MQRVSDCWEAGFNWILKHRNTLIIPPSHLPPSHPTLVTPDNESNSTIWWTLDPGTYISFLGLVLPILIWTLDILQPREKLLLILTSFLLTLIVKSIFSVKLWHVTMSRTNVLSHGFNGAGLGKLFYQPHGSAFFHDSLPGYLCQPPLSHWWWMMLFQWIYILMSKTWK